MTTLMNAEALLAWLGRGAIPGIFLVLFAETGLLVGFILPGDSLLLTAGLLCALGTGPAHLSLPWVLASATAGTVLGTELGYLLGRRAGNRLRARGRSAHVAAAFDRTERLLARFGMRRALIVSRFLPVVRTVIGPTAGATGTPARFFALWQAVGAVLWTAGMTMAGYAVGALIPGAEHAVDLAVALSVLLLPLLILVRFARTRFRLRRAGSGAARDDAPADPTRAGSRARPPRTAPRRTRSSAECVSARIRPSRPGSADASRPCAPSRTTARTPDAAESWSAP
jgi:membrane-associated protein